MSEGKAKDVNCSQRTGERCKDEAVKLTDEENGVFETLKDTTLLLPQSEIIAISEVKHLAAFSLGWRICCFVGLLIKHGVLQSGAISISMKIRFCRRKVINKKEKEGR